MFERITQFENMLSEYTGAPYVVATDCCTHALELCFRLTQPEHITFSSFTYLSIPMMLYKINQSFSYLDHDKQVWEGEYRFHGSNIWDSARLLTPMMYREGQMQCLSFGYDKPLEIGRGGAILLDDVHDYTLLKMMAYDGRDLTITPWQDQGEFMLGYHYKMTIEEAEMGMRLLNDHLPTCSEKKYPDLRNVSIHK